jgi:hypothetical protein
MANASETDRTVYVPSGDVYTMMPVHAENIFNITIHIDGLVYASEDNVNWPI